jgi:hypothetical protein
MQISKTMVEKSANMRFGRQAYTPFSIGVLRTKGELRYLFPDFSLNDTNFITRY